MWKKGTNSMLGVDSDNPGSVLVPVCARWVRMPAYDKRLLFYMAFFANYSLICLESFLQTKEGYK